ncbi:MAG: ABC transporter ATP-binding protein [Candidatus Limnocylindria bacterium]
MAASGAVVEFEHVTKRYGNGPPAVDDLSLRVPGGKICVLVGPSGCGKTTTMKMVNRLVEPTSGRVTIDGRDVMDFRAVELRRGIGYVIQQVGLFPHLTVGANVGVVPRLLGWRTARVDARTDELLELVGLEPATFRDRYPSELSGGERQRVGVARALAADPPVMLMDEPFGAVDPIRREQLQNQLLRLQAQVRKTILFVTHDVDEAIKMADRLAIMRRGGVLAQYDTPDAVLAHPAGDFVERFVGADRGLKRLSLTRVRDVPLRDPVVAQAGEPADAVRRRLDEAGSEYALAVDGAGRPAGWFSRAELRDAEAVDLARATPLAPPLEPESTLRDALSGMLASSVQLGVVVDDQGRAVGLLSIDTVGETLRQPRREPEAPRSA